MIAVAAPAPFVSARSIHPEQVSPVVVQAETEGGHHFVIADAEGNHRLSFIGDTGRGGQAFLIPHDDDFGARLHALQHFHHKLYGRPAGPPLRSLTLSLTQRTRLALQLRALDGVHDGVTRREIAAVLLDPAVHAVPAIEWKSSALRKRINRLLATANELMNGGYLALLRPDSSRAERFRREQP